jgi:gas vesicle protein GvpA/GvpJ/GvpM family
MSGQHSLTHAVESTNLADLLDRILDKGVVIAGDISIRLVEVELLTIQLRLVICSVSKACELGLDWWNHDTAAARQVSQQKAAVASLDQRIGRLEQALSVGAAIEAANREPR